MEQPATAPTRDSVMPPAAPWRVARPGDDCAGGRRLEERLAVRHGRSIAIVPLEAIIRLEADDNYVRVFADREYRHKSTLAALCSRLEARYFLRVHRRHAVNLAMVRELHPLWRGEYRLMLRDGTVIRTGRRYAGSLAGALGLA